MAALRNIVDKGKELNSEFISDMLIKSWNEDNIYDPDADETMNEQAESSYDSLARFQWEAQSERILLITYQHLF